CDAIIVYSVSANTLSRNTNSFASRLSCDLPLPSWSRTQLEQLDHFGAQFLNLVIVRSQLQGSARFEISFSPRPPGFIWINSPFQSMIGKASAKTSCQTRIRRIELYRCPQTIECPLVSPV